MRGFLLSQINAADRSAVNEENFERIEDSLAFSLRPSLVDGVPTEDLGAPAAGTYAVGDLWVDSLGAVFRCTDDSPLMWIQIKPAFVADVPVGDIPNNYWIKVPSQRFMEYAYDGANWLACFTQPAP